MTIEYSFGNTFELRSVTCLIASWLCYQEPEIETGRSSFGDAWVSAGGTARRSWCNRRRGRGWTLVPEKQNNHVHWSNTDVISARVQQEKPVQRRLLQFMALSFLSCWSGQGLVVFRMNNQPGMELQSENTDCYVHCWLVVGNGKPSTSASDKQELNKINSLALLGKGGSRIGWQETTALAKRTSLKTSLIWT